MTTRAGCAIVFAGAFLIVLRMAGVVNSEPLDIISVVLIVAGALAIAIDGEPKNPKPN